MKRYLIASFLFLVPLYGMSRATAELMTSMEESTVTESLASVDSTPTILLVEAQNSQFMKVAE